MARTFTSTEKARGGYSIAQFGSPVASRFYNGCDALTVYEYTEDGATLYAYRMANDPARDGLTFDQLNAELEELAGPGFYELSDLPGLSNEELADLIRRADTWDLDLLEELADRAGLAEEWTAADGEMFEAVAYRAAEILGVEI